MAGIMRKKEKFDQIVLLMRNKVEVRTMWLLLDATWFFKFRDWCTDAQLVDEPPGPIDNSGILDGINNLIFSFKLFN